MPTKIDTDNSEILSIKLDMDHIWSTAGIPVHMLKDVETIRLFLDLRNNHPEEIIIRVGDDEEYLLSDIIKTFSDMTRAVHKRSRVEFDELRKAQRMVGGLEETLEK